MLKSNPKELRRIREQKGYTGRSLARASGISQPRIWELEQGQVVVRPTTAKQIAEALGVEITDITVYEDDVFESVEAVSG